MESKSHLCSERIKEKTEYHRKQMRKYFEEIFNLNPTECFKALCVYCMTARQHL